MTRLETTREVLFDIAGYSPFAPHQLEAKHRLVADLAISGDLLKYLASRLTARLRAAGTKRRIPSTALQVIDFTVAATVALVISKMSVRPIETADAAMLIAEALEEIRQAHAA